MVFIARRNRPEENYYNVWNFYIKDLESSLPPRMIHTVRRDDLDGCGGLSFHPDGRQLTYTQVGMGLGSTSVWRLIFDVEHDYTVVADEPIPGLSWEGKNFRSTSGATFSSDGKWMLFSSVEGMPSGYFKTIIILREVDTGIEKIGI